MWYHWLVLILLLCGGTFGVFGQKSARKTGRAQLNTLAEPVNRYVGTDQKISLIPADSATSADQLARYIETHFSSDEERVRAVYGWLSRNISYDVDNLYTFKMIDDVQKVVSDVFTRRKAICQGYAEAFTMICKRMNIRSYVIGGYTRRGSTLATLPHAWNAAWIDGHWYLFDPTWGAGFIEKQVFVAQPNDTFFLIAADEFLPTHIPFDPLWQFTDHPVSHRDFMQGKIQPDLTRPYFSYVDSLAVYEGQSTLDKMTAEARRVEQSGVHNDLTFNYLSVLKRNVDVLQRNGVADQYNAAVDLYNQTVRLVNEFINYRNNQFVPQKPEAEVRMMLDSISSKLAQVRIITGQLPTDAGQLSRNVQQLEGALLDIDKLLDEQRLFVNKYYKSPKWLRKLLISK